MSTKRKFKYVGPHNAYLDQYMSDDKIVDEDFTWGSKHFTVGEIVDGNRQDKLQWEEIKEEPATNTLDWPPFPEGEPVDESYKTRTSTDFEFYNDVQKNREKSNVILETAKIVLPRLIAKANSGYTQLTPEYLVTRAFDIAEEFQKQADERKLL